ENAFVFPHEHKRKKQRTSQFNEQESEAVENHKKIRDILATSTLHIVSLGKKSGYFKEKIKDSCPGKYIYIYTVHIVDCLFFCIEKDFNPDKLFSSHVVEHASSSPSLVHLQDGWYILPPSTTYLMSDDLSLHPLVDHVQSKGSFDVVVLDPPWYNKSAKRSGKYSFLSLWQIKSLPVPRLLSDQCLVVVWVTNKPKYINFTRGELFTHWSIEYLAEWHWVKVTRTGELVVDFDSPHKRPYETLILGRYNSSARYCNSEQCNVKSSEINADSIVDNSYDDCTSTVKDRLDDNGLPCDNNKHRKPIPDHLVICSVPCQIHSRKPHLQDILAEFVCPDAKCLEMFARNLTTGWTSWGNEVQIAIKCIRFTFP
ncbi:hypothetical protein QZH41_018148, partial [Actinostola sp. cb2023]